MCQQRGNADEQGNKTVVPVRVRTDDGRTGSGNDPVLRTDTAGMYRKHCSHKTISGKIKDGEET